MIPFQCQMFTFLLFQPMGTPSGHSHGWLHPKLIYLCKSCVPHSLKVLLKVCHQRAWASRHSGETEHPKGRSRVSAARRFRVLGKRPCRQDPSWPCIAFTHASQPEAQAPTGQLNPRLKFCLPPFRKRTGRNQSLYWGPTAKQQKLEPLWKPLEAGWLSHHSLHRPPVWHLAYKLCALATVGDGGACACVWCLLCVYVCRCGAQVECRHRLSLA